MHKDTYTLLELDLGVNADPGCNGGLTGLGGNLLGVRGDCGATGFDFMDRFYI